MSGPEWVELNTQETLIHFGEKKVKIFLTPFILQS